MNRRASLATRTPASASAVRPLAAWARLKSPTVQEREASFLAGAALASLDAIVRMDAPWAGAWRQRLALRCAAASWTGRGGDERALRDAWHGVGRTGADPGPAGRAYGAWRDLAGRSTSLSPERLLRAVQAFGASHGTAALGDLVADPLGAAALAVSSTGDRASGLWLADLVIASRFRWPVPVPLLAGGIETVSRTVSGRVRPGEPGWFRAVALAYAEAAGRAVDLAGDLSRRAAALDTVVPKLRAKGAGAVVTALLNDDAVSASRPFPDLSGRGARRLFDRLVALSVVRELTGRPTFRLYGL